MSALKTHLLLCAALALAAAGCADALSRVAVPVPEYTAYRRFRLAETAESKLGAGYRYLKSYPEGTYRPEVRSWLARESAAYVRRAWNDPVRLQAFVDEVPSGPIADRAAVRLVQLTVKGEYRSERERLLDERALALTERVAAAEKGRRELVVGVAGWARRIAAIRSWGGRTSELDSDFIYHFRLTEPAARCTDTECQKTVFVSYAVPEGKTQSEREAVYDVGLRLENGGVRAAWITGADLFTRIGEAVSVASVSNTDLVARVEAIGQAAQVIAIAVEPSFPEARCAVEPVSPVILHRRCDGLELRVVSAVELGEEDRVIVAPVASPASTNEPSPKIHHSSTGSAGLREGSSP